MSSKRSTLAPDVPTTEEVGLPQLAFAAWWALWGPPHLPADLVATLNGWVNAAVQALAAEARLAVLGIEAAAETPEAFAKFIMADLERSARIPSAAKFEPH
jgi:tripartite-type tricarboxylate transporter receptor subunit TctC